jgi:hypothetical protein
VFDAVWAHIAGAARLDINERFGTPNALLMFGSTHFPYAVTAQRDPLTGKTDGLLDNDRARKNQPKLFLTNTAVEYWGGGRSAALNHTTADGKADLAPPPNVRIYYLAGTQHSPGRFPPKAITGQQPVNPVDYWHINRALFVALDKWVREGTEPPASQYPKLSDGTLVPASRVAFPPIPGVHSPKAIPPARTDGKALPLLVPQVDADGNDRVGIRLPEITVPVATYTGWNFRTPVNGGPDLLVDLVGSAIPLPATAADAQARKDPRRPVAARYASRDAYLAKAREAAEGLVKAGYLLQQDVEPVMKRMQDQWELVVGR